MKLKNLLYITVGSALLTACSADYLDTLPQSSTDTGTVFETTENARLAVNGLCLMMTQQYLGQQGVNGEGTIKTWYGNYPGNDFQKCNLTGWADIINATSFLERNSSLYCYYPWFYYYKLIGNANRIVAHIDQAEGPEAERLFIRAQALTVRAYAYLMLSQLYCHRWADSGADLLEEVKLYRRIELWGEGFDWFDLKRWRQPIVRHAHPEGSFHAQFAVSVQPEEGNQWTWVYPAKEVDYNGALDSYIE